MHIRIRRIDHIQICIPEGEEEGGRDFYCRLLGLKEIEKPEALKKNGGFWLKAGDVQIHIGTEKMEKSTSKRHPAFEIDDLDAVKIYLQEQGIRVKEEQAIPGLKRFSFFDYWENRIEFLEVDGGC